MSVLSLLSNVFVNGHGQPTVLWVVTALAVFAFHVWTSRPRADAARRRGDAFPSVLDPALPPDALDVAVVSNQTRKGYGAHLWPVDEHPSATRS